MSNTWEFLKPCECKAQDDRIEELEAKLSQATCFQIAEDVFVEKRGEGKWCVRAFGNTVVDRDLKRQYEPMPSSRTEEFIAATRFSLDEAFDIAKRYNQVD